MTDYQPSLFSAAEAGGSYRVVPKTLTMSQAALTDWKQRVGQFQQQVRLHRPPKQGSLFAAEPPQTVQPTQTPTADAINPFDLPQQNIEFWRWRAADAGVSALYFVIDYDSSLLLYVGETVKSNQRWKGEHDCKRYLLNYRQAHVEHNLPTQLGIAFWHGAPAATRPRQVLESALINRWRSPFNKENWHVWATPFIGST